MRVLEKMFWAMETERAPPRELKKMAIASAAYRAPYRTVSRQVRRLSGWGGGKGGVIGDAGMDLCGAPREWGREKKGKDERMDEKK